MLKEKASGGVEQPGEGVTGVDQRVGHLHGALQGMRQKRHAPERGVRSQGSGRAPPDLPLFASPPRSDATERRDKAAFRTFAHPYFAAGKGWTFTPRNRHVDLSHDGRVAWFDELLDSASYGECRGSGVLEKVDGGWIIVQYHLTIPMPNDLAKELVERIREAKKAPAQPR